MNHRTLLPLLLALVGCGMACSGAQPHSDEASDAETRAKEMSRAVVPAVDAALPEFRQCYEPELDRNPDLWGEIAIEFTIGREGGVAHREIKESSLPPRVAQCIADVFARLETPAPHERDKHTFHYSLCFEPDRTTYGGCVERAPSE